MTFDPDEYIERGMRFVERDVARKFMEDIKKEQKMAFVQSEKTFSLFVNDKGDNPKRPDLTGAAMIDGVEYKLSAWKSEAKSGTKYFSGKIQKVEKTIETPKTGSQILDNDEIVF